MNCPVCYQPCATNGCTEAWCATFAGGPPPAGTWTASTCPTCSRSYGWYYYGCSAMPKNGNRPCTDCVGANGHHTKTCRTRGYQMPSTGSAPTERPAAAAVARCECGVDKAGVGGLHSSWCAKAE